MAVVNKIEQLYADLKTEWNKKSSNLQKCGTLLNQLKIELVKICYLPTRNSTAQKSDLILARNILEIAVEYSIAIQDIPAFERYICQLKCYYFDYKNLIGVSENMYKVLGLNLLFLLSVNRVSQFHTELELLPAEIIQANKFIKPILSLEQYIMEGRYNKIFQAKKISPDESYMYFMDILLDTVRNEIGACLEKSYEKISLIEAGKRLNLQNKADIEAFGKKKEWKINEDGFFYFTIKPVNPKEPLPTVELAEQAISYARELEMIV